MQNELKKQQDLMQNELFFYKSEYNQEQKFIWSELHEWQIFGVLNAHHLICTNLCMSLN